MGRFPPFVLHPPVGHLGNIWNHLGSILEASTLGFPPWPQRCWRNWIPWHPFDTPGLLLGTPWTFLGTFLMPRAPLGTPWTALGINFWLHGAAPWHPMDIPWQQLWPSSVNVLKMIKTTIILSSISGVFLGRVYMQSDHAGAVQTHILHILLLSISRRPKKQKVEMRCGPGGRPSVTPPG